MNGEPLNFDVLADDNLRTLKLPDVSFKKPVCIFLVGYPGSGKTYLVKKITEQFPVTALIEKDMTNLLAPRATPIERGAVEVFQLAYKTIERLIVSGKACIYDGNVKTKEQRDLIRKAVEDAEGEPVLIYVKADKDLCYLRVKKQNLGVTRGEEKGYILDKDYFEYEIVTTRLPSQDETYIVHDSQNTESIYKVMTIIGKKLKSLK